MVNLVLPNFFTGDYTEPSAEDIFNAAKGHIEAVTPQTKGTLPDWESFVLHKTSFNYSIYRVTLTVRKTPETEFFTDTMLVDFVVRELAKWDMVFSPFGRYPEHSGLLCMNSYQAEESCGFVSYYEAELNADADFHKLHLYIHGLDLRSLVIMTNALGMHNEWLWAIHLFTRGVAVFSSYFATNNELQELFPFSDSWNYLRKTVKPNGINDGVKFHTDDQLLLYHDWNDDWDLDRFVVEGALDDIPSTARRLIVTKYIEHKWE